MLTDKTAGAQLSSIHQPDDRPTLPLPSHVFSIHHRGIASTRNIQGLKAPWSLSSAASRWSQPNTIMHRQGWGTVLILTGQPTKKGVSRNSPRASGERWYQR